MKGPVIVVCVVVNLFVRVGDILVPYRCMTKYGVFQNLVNGVFNAFFWLLEDIDQIVLARCSLITQRFGE